MSAVALKWAWYGTEMAPSDPVDTPNGMYGVYVPNVQPSKFDGLRFLNDGTPFTTPLTLSHAENTSTLNDVAMEYPLSPEFIRIMTSQELQDKIVSATGAYFSLDQPVYVPEVDTTVVQFYRDQQDCIVWYLVVEGALEGHVIASPLHVEEVDVDDEGPSAIVRYWNDEIVVCATSLPEFLYRTWIENQIWYQLNEPSGDVASTASPYVVAECAWYEAENDKLGRTCR